MIAPAISSAGSSDTSANASSNLTQANFLQLLVAQMTSQDPLNPESDTDFAAQLAQFSALQESTAMAGSISIMQASSLIGATVTVASATNSTQTSTGVVSAVSMSSGAPEIEVDGKYYGLGQIQSIAQTVTTSTSAPTPSSNL